MISKLTDFFRDPIAFLATTMTLTVGLIGLVIVALVLYQNVAGY